MKEFQIQIAVASHFKALECVLKTFTFFHVPNGGLRSKSAAAKLKAMGVRAGVHDLVFLLNGGGCLLIELKNSKGRPSENQKAFFGIVEKLGHASYLVEADDGNDAINQITGILKAHGVKI